MNIKNRILNVPKHGNKHDLIHFVTLETHGWDKVHQVAMLLPSVCKTIPAGELGVAP